MMVMRVMMEMRTGMRARRRAMRRQSQAWS
jgi:hypothetical protein